MTGPAAVRAARAASAEEIAEARGWVQDCVADPESVDDADPQRVVLYVDREYEGGWAAFLTEIGGAS